MIPLIKSTFYREAETKKALCEFINSGDFLSMGHQCEMFEKKFSEFQQRKYSIMFNSGSSANLALIQALLNLGRIQKGEAMGVSCLTWATNVMPLIQLGLKPFPIDVNLATLNIDEEEFEKNSNSIKSLFLTNALGFSSDLEKMLSIAKKKNILMLEDNCESLGSVYQGTKLGNFSLAATFSFFVGHHMSTIEGGMVSTDDEVLADMLKMVRSHGWSRNLEKEKREALSQKNNITPFQSNYSFYDLGYNLRPSEINGFIGVLQLNHLDEIIKNRVANFKKLHQASLSNPDIYPLEIDHLDVVSNFAFPMVFKSQESFEKHQQCLLQKKIEYRPIIGGCIANQPFYKKYIGEENVTSRYPNTTLIDKRGLYIPNNPELNEIEINILLDIAKGNI